MPTLSQTSIIITGVSRGLGAALFDEYHHDGARILALGRTFTPRQRIAALADPQRVRLRATNLQDSTSLPAADEIADFLQSGRPDQRAVLVHNAAIAGPVGRIGTLTDADLAASAQVNLIAPMQLTNTFIAALPPQMAGRICYVTSSAARNPYPGWAAYCATKAAAEVFIQCAATDRCETRIIDPGAMDTGMHAYLRKTGKGMPGHDRLIQRHASGNLAHPRSAAVHIAQRTLADVDGAEPKRRWRRIAYATALAGVPFSMAAAAAQIAC